jgi:hypothetical protein
VANIFDFENAFISRDYFCFAQRLRALLLADVSPGDGTTRSGNDITRQRSKLEEFEWSFIGDCVSKLPTPAC